MSDLLSSESAEKRPRFPKRAVVTAGMPYGNKALHFGHIGGVFVPADFFARFLRDRLGAQNVLFISGTDCYGSPIAEGHRKKVEQEGSDLTIEAYVQGNHDAQKEALDAYNISLNLFAGSGLGRAREIHAQLTKDLITRLWEKGYLIRRSTKQFYDTEAESFLNGRQVQGRCPVRGCKSEKAYADECDLGHQFDPEELINPVSALSGTTPELRAVENWYFDLPAFEHELEELTHAWDADEKVRNVTVKTMRESLVAPQLYIQLPFEEAYHALADTLPTHTFIPAKENQQSFVLKFDSWREREAAKTILEEHDIRFRCGKCLLPFRITGNIEWGVAAPVLEDLTDLTVWCWPESLWAPISFTKTLLEAQPDAFESADWRSWWCSDEAEVYQFIGQDNIYFYCVAQSALWKALDWNLTQDTPLANYHILFMNKKASSSGAIKPPMALDLLEHYRAEDLRAHWLSLALDQKAVSFSPKAFDTSCSYVDKKTGQAVAVVDDPRVADPALKESAFLSNIFNRLARSCFYGANRLLDAHLPRVQPAEDALQRTSEALIAFEQAVARFDAHGALGVVEEFCRQANKIWDETSKACRDDDAGYEQALADAFHALKTCTLMMHPACPEGCELICQTFNISPEIFFSWNHAFVVIDDLVRADGNDPQTHELVRLEPRFDFFKKHQA